MASSKTLSRKVTIYINGTQVKDTLKDLSNAVRDLEREQKKLPIGSDDYVKASLKIAEIKTVIKAQEQAIKDLSKTTEDARKKAADLSNILVGLKTLWQKGGDLYSWAKGLSDEAAKMDDVYADVMKTTGLTHDEVMKLNETFKQMDTRTAREELNKLASEAGKLGRTGVDAVVSFTASADKIKVALGEDLGEEATTVIGKMADVYTRSTKELSDAGDDLGAKMLRIGSAINSLGAASSAAEPHMVDFLARLGGMASQAGLSAQQVLGYASALDQSGVSVEKSATAFQNFMAKMMQKPAEFAAIARQGVGEFRQLMETDMDAAIKAVLAGLNEEGGMTKLAPLFKDLQLSGQGVTTMLTTLKGSIDKVNDAQAIANTQMSTGSSIEEEFATKNNTLQARMDKAREVAHDATETLGNELYPVIIHLTEAGGNLANRAAGLIQLLREQPAIIIPIVTALGALGKARLLNIANIIKEHTVTKVKNAIAKKEELQTMRNAAVAATLKAEREQERIAIMKAELAEAKKIAMMKVEEGDYSALTAKTMAQGRAEQLETALKKQATVATEARTAATKAETAAIEAEKAAMMATPWGLIITSLASIGTALYSIWKNSDRVKLAQVMRDAAKEAGEAEGKVKVLFERLKDAAAGSEAYKRAVDDLKAAYPDLIAKHVDEEGKIRNLSAAYNELSAAARQSVYDRMYADKVSETQGDISNSMAKRIEKVSKWIDKAGKELSEAERTYMKQQFNTLFSEASTGAANTVEIMKRANDILVKNGIDANGFRSQQIKDQLMQMMGESKIAQKNLDALRVDMGANSPDPFGVQKMSLEQLNSELAKAERLLKSYRKQIDNGRDGYAEKLDSETKKIAALREQIAKLQNDKKNETETPTTNGDYDTTDPKELEKQRKDAAKEAESNRKAWDKAQKDAEKMIRQYKLKAESGLQKVKDDVDQKTAEIVERLKATAEAAGESSEDLEKRLSAAAEEYKKTKVEEYLASVNKEIDRLRKNTAKSGDNKMLEKVSQATEELRQKLNNIDIQINKLGTDKKLLEGKADEDSKKLLKEIEERLKQLGEIRSAAISSAYSNIKDFEINNPFESTNNLSFSDNKAKALEEIERKAKEYEKSLNDAIEAEEELARVSGENGDYSAAVEHQANAAALKEEAEALDELSEEAEKLARFDALSETLKSWCDQIQQFSDQAISIFSNINTLLDNIADSELQKMEREKNEAIENLDEQLEQGLISQEDYNEQKEALDDEYEAKEKEKELEQWKRQKALDYTQAIIDGALAAVRAYAEGGPYLGPALAAMVAAATGIEIAAIASQPEPYAKGGYVPRRTVYQAGEAGPEWVASNQLLSDPQTAPIIQTLEDYQRGNRHALADIPMAQLDMPAAISASEQIGRNRVVVQPQSAAAVWEHPTAAAVGNDSREMVNLMRELVTYEKDPRNRQAVISRRTMDDFNNNENFLRNRARL